MGLSHLYTSFKNFYVINGVGKMAAPSRARQICVSSWEITEIDLFLGHLAGIGFPKPKVPLLKCKPLCVRVSPGLLQIILSELGESSVNADTMAAAVAVSDKAPCVQPTSLYVSSSTHVSANSTHC